MADPFERGAADVFRSVLAESAVFTPAAGGAGTDTRALVSRNLEVKDRFGTVLEVDIAIQLPRAVAGLPEKSATVAVSGTTYRIDRIVTYDSHAVTVSASHG